MKQCNICSKMFDKIALAITVISSSLWLGMPLGVNLVAEQVQNPIIQSVIYGILGLSGIYLVVKRCMCIQSKGSCGLCKVKMPAVGDSKKEKEKKSDK